MPRSHHLHRFAFTAVRRSPEFPELLIADSIAGVPELRSDPGVGAVSQQSRSLPFFDFVTQLSPELKVETHVVDAPGAIGLHINTVVGVGDHVLKVPRAWLE